MHRSHSAFAEREVSICDLTARPEFPKVVRVITRLNVGGPSIHTVLLTREMPARAYRTLLVAGSCEPDDADMSYLLAPGDPVRWVPELSRSVRPWRNLKALWKLWRLMRHERPDIVHTHTAMAGGLGRLAAALSRVPIVIHTFHGNCLDEYFSPIGSAIFRRIEQVLALLTDCLCVVSPQQAAELSERFHIAPAYKFHVVPLGLDLDDYLALHPPAGHGPLTVGWFGRMVPVKNIALLADIIGQTLQRSPHIRFLIAGDGPDRTALSGLIDRFRGRMTCLGWKREILPEMARCDVLLQTSRNEGTPVALIQGMAAARPFVSTSAGGVVDMVSGGLTWQAGGARWYPNGVLVEPDAGAFSGVLLALEKDRALVSRLGCAGRDFAASHYRKERLTTDIDSLYRQLLNRRRT